MTHTLSTAIYEMDHLASEFQNRNFFRQNLQKAQVKLLFCVKSIDGDQQYPIDLVSVRIPANFPNYNIRTLIKSVERKLKDIYEEVGLIGTLIKHQGTMKWTFDSRAIDSIATVAFE